MYEPPIDKIELAKALRYDRDQYEKGYDDCRKSFLVGTDKAKITNADKIRFMTDTQLAVFLNEITNCDSCPLDERPNNNQPCGVNILRWLREEVKQ